MQFIMYQKQEGKLKDIAYGSRRLTAPEKNYYLHSEKLEFLAMKYRQYVNISDTHQHP